MWTRKTWHESANELSQLSEQFVSYHWDHRRKFGTEHTYPIKPRMLETSLEAVKLLRSLALSIRGDQDYGRTENFGVVGALKKNITGTEIREYKQSHENLTVLLENSLFTPLSLRDGLNKIAHADPSNSDYYVGPRIFVEELRHDLLLQSTVGGTWFAIVSLTELVKVIKSLPDAETDI